MSIKIRPSFRIYGEKRNKYPESPAMKTQAIGCFSASWMGIPALRCAPEGMTAFCI